MKNFRSVTALCMLLSACGADDKQSNNPELVYTLYQSPLARDLTPDINNTQFKQLVLDNNQFALDVFHQLRSGSQEDVVASPFSISTALAMTYAGASGDTKQQMAQALRFHQEDALLHAGFNELTSVIADRNLPAVGPLDALDIKIVNAIWPVLGSIPADDFLDTLAVNYGEGVYALDYKNEPEQSRVIINDTVEGWTRGLITDLLPQGAITDLTEVVLTNTLYLKAPWDTPFSEQLTQPREFNNLDGSVNSVDTMTGEATVYYAAHDNAETLILPFRGDELEMAFIVPSVGEFQDYLALVVDAESLAEQLDAAKQMTASVQLPKFKSEFEASLIEPLRSLGMVDAFTDAANFDAMGLSEDLRLTAIVHKAVIEVHEHGVIAAAATAAVGGVTSVPTPVIVDRPFIYLVRDRATGATLFIGTVTQL